MAEKLLEQVLRHTLVRQVLRHRVTQQVRVAFYDGDTVTIGSKTDRADTPPFLLTQLETLFPKAKLAKVFGTMPVTLYGEGYGAKIQSGGSYLHRRASSSSMFTCTPTSMLCGWSGTT